MRNPNLILLKRHVNKGNRSLWLAHSKDVAELAVKFYMNFLSLVVPIVFFLKKTWFGDKFITKKQQITSMGDTPNYVIFTQFLRKPERHPNAIWTPFERVRFFTWMNGFERVRFFSWKYGFFHGGISQNLKIFWEPKKTLKFMKIYHKSQKDQQLVEKNIQKPIIESFGDRRYVALTSYKWKKHHLKNKRLVAS